jgi:membrane-bound ClpP family serine protease
MNRGEWRGTVAFYVVGILLLVAEVFLPTFGIIGILGILCVIAGVVMTADDVQSAVVSIGVALLIVAAAVTIAVRVLKLRGIWSKFILREELTTEKGYTSHASRAHLVGLSGTALTPLRPAGTADIGGERIDVVTSGEFIATGSKISVLRLEGAAVIVRQLPE